MIRKLALFLLLFVFAVPAFAQDGYIPGLTVTCNDGTVFNNGVEVVVVQMRSGYSYTATAIGIDGFDPVLAVLETDTLNGLCNDDAPAARNYGADLPSTGRVRASNLSAQISFSQDSPEPFADVSLVVGGYGNQRGEFILFLEGMAVTNTDGAGDAFSVNITPGMINSGVALTTYMLTANNSETDPLIYQVIDGTTTEVMTDSRGNDIYCDDSGDSSSCYNVGVPLEDYGVTISTGDLSGWQYDAMLTSDLSGVRLNDDRDFNYYTYYMTSYQNQTQGPYLLAFHAGIG